LVELNSTIFPILGPIGTFVNTLKVFVGGVFGIYLIILYIRWREYALLRKMYRELKRDIRAIAKKQKVELEPVKQHAITTFGQKVRQKLAGRKARKEAKKKQDG
jgi:hypothetical protein